MTSSISPRTVEVYRASTMEKLGVNTLSELVRLGHPLILEAGKYAFSFITPK